MSALAENTYRMGFFGVFNSPGLGDWVTAHHPMQGVAFEPSVDHALFHAQGRTENIGPVRIFFYGRPSTDRNAFELGVEALRIVKKRLGNAVKIVCAGEAFRLGWFGANDFIENLGVLPYRDTAELYRSTDIGLCFMFTKHPSYLPLEMMASGVTVVTNDNPANAWLLRDRENCLLAQPTASLVAAQIEAAVKDPALRARIGAEAARRLAASDWDSAANVAWTGLARHYADPAATAAAAR
jgi:glycosyltransferase involved in cell wall biosynthesis